MSQGSEEAKRIRPEKIHMVDFRVLRSSIEVSDAFLDSDELIDNIDIGQEAMYQVGVGNDQVDLRIEVLIQGKNKDQEPLEVVGRFRIDFLFRVNELETFTTKEGDQVTVSGALIATLAGIAYSTSRGLINDRLSASPLKGVILPVIDPKELLRKEAGGSKQ